MQGIFIYQIEMLCIFILVTRAINYLSAAALLKMTGQNDVFHNAEIGNQVELLKDYADMVGAETIPCSTDQRLQGLTKNFDCPDWATKMPAMRLSNVDFPLPLLPFREIRSPLMICRFINFFVGQ